MKKCLVAILIACLFFIGCATSNRWTHLTKTKTDSVVGIWVKYTNPKTLESEYFTMGTGFVLEKNVVGTAAHVITALTKYDGLSDAHIRLSNGKRLEIDVVYMDIKKDVGLIITTGMKNVDAFKIKYRIPSKGEEIFTIGYPRGVKNTVSTGIVMNVLKRGGSKDKMDIIYVGARIAGGASGSAAMDINGNVIGVLVEIRYDQYGWYNYNVSPIKYIKKLLVSYHKEKHNKTAMKMRREIYNINGEGDDW